MKARQLIKKLEELIEKHGENTRVVINKDSRYYDDVTEVRTRVESLSSNKVNPFGTVLVGDWGVYDPSLSTTAIWIG